MTKATHFFTEEYPDKDNKATTNSTHPQTKFWPSYLPVNEDRLFIFERSKNAQLVVYTANYSDKDKCLLDPKNPLDITWQSFGWTDNPTCNPTGMVERKMAWGYSHSAIQPGSASATALPSDVGYGTQCELTLNALSSRKAQLYSTAKGHLILQTTINEVPSRLWKVFVCTNTTAAFIPKVLYVELYGTNVANGEDTYERIQVSS